MHLSILSTVVNSQLSMALVVCICICSPNQFSSLIINSLSKVFILFSVKVIMTISIKLEGIKIMDVI